MSRAAVIGFGAISPLGRGSDAFDVTADAPLVAIEHDASLARAGFSRPLVARVADDALARAYGPDEDRATVLLGTAFEDVIASLDDVSPAWRDARVGVAIGTSSGGMMSAERFFDDLADASPIDASRARAATYFAPLDDVLARTRLRPARRSQLVNACAASTWAIGLGLLWLRRGVVDVVLAGGYDAHTRFVHAGFDALRATSTRLPAPFRVGREGMSLGEGAAIVALVREADARSAASFFVSGFGASTDAVHVTAPDRTGAGLARAMRRAIADADVDAADCVAVSAHATATPFNDAMESRALRDVVGIADPAVHPFKAQIGHTLGAAGVLETLAIGHALSARILPPAAGEGPVDDDARVRLLERAAPIEREAAWALKASAAFGGVNAALVVESRASRREAAGPRTVARPCVIAHRSIVEADEARIARVTGIPRDTILRVDDVSRLGLGAVAALLEGLDSDAPPLDDAAIVVGHALATLDVNQRFWSRIRERGPAAAEPRVFPPTSPNLVAGQIAIHFGIKGPSVAVCRGLDGGVEAIEVAADLVASGAVTRAVVVAIDLVGPASAAFADAVLASDERASLVTGAAAVLVESSPTRDAAIPLDRELARPIGHRGLAHVIDALRER